MAIRHPPTDGSSSGAQQQPRRAVVVGVVAVSIVVLAVATLSASNTGSTETTGTATVPPPEPQATARPTTQAPEPPATSQMASSTLPPVQSGVSTISPEPAPRRARDVPQCDLSVPPLTEFADVPWALPAAKGRASAGSCRRSVNLPRKPTVNAWVSLPAARRLAAWYRAFAAAASGIAEKAGRRSTEEPANASTAAATPAGEQEGADLLPIPVASLRPSERGELLRLLSKLVYDPAVVGRSPWMPETTAAAMNATTGGSGAFTVPWCVSSGLEQSLLSWSPSGGLLGVIQQLEGNTCDVEVPGTPAPQTPAMQSARIVKRQAAAGARRFAAKAMKEGVGGGGETRRCAAGLGGSPLHIVELGSEGYAAPQPRPGSVAGGIDEPVPDFRFLELVLPRFANVTSIAVFGGHASAGPSFRNLALAGTHVQHAPPGLRAMRSPTQPSRAPSPDAASQHSRRPTASVVIDSTGAVTITKRRDSPDDTPAAPNAAPEGNFDVVTTSAAPAATDETGELAASLPTPAPPVATAKPSDPHAWLRFVPALPWVHGGGLSLRESAQISFAGEAGCAISGSSGAHTHSHTEHGHSHSHEDHGHSHEDHGHSHSHEDNVEHHSHGEKYSSTPAPTAAPARCACYPTIDVASVLGPLPFGSAVIKLRLPGGTHTVAERILLDARSKAAVAEAFIACDESEQADGGKASLLLPLEDEDASGGASSSSWGGGDGPTAPWARALLSAVRRELLCALVHGAFRDAGIAVHQLD